MYEKYNVYKYRHIYISKNRLNFHLKHGVAAVCLEFNIIRYTIDTKENELNRDGKSIAGKANTRAWLNLGPVFPMFQGKMNFSIDTGARMKVHDRKGKKVIRWRECNSRAKTTERRSYL